MKSRTVPDFWKMFHNLPLLIALALGLGLTLALLGLSGSPSEVVLSQSGTGVIRVATTGSDTPGCGSELSPCRTVQYGVDQALPGEEIRVATGVYTGVQARAGITQVVYLDKTVTVRGGYTTTNWSTPYPITQPTTLDAEGLGRVLVISGTVAPSVEGLHITGGNATGLGGLPQEYIDAGGGVYVYTATPTMNNCLIYSNTASIAGWGDGGGLFLRNSATTLSGNTIAGNIASTAGSGYGGGLFLFESGATLTGNTVVSNTASTADWGHGGGLYLWHSDDATLSGNAITSNTAGTGGSGYGGGLYFSESSVVLNDSTVQGNAASTADEGYGGGLYLARSAAMLSGNTVQDNTASATDWGYGGGLYLYESGATLRGNMVASNTASTGDRGHGGGLYLFESGATLNGNVVVSNTATRSPTAIGRGGGLIVYRTHSFTLTNNVVAGNHANTEGSGLYCEGSSTDPTSGHLLHTTVADNRSSGQGVFVEEHTTLVLANTIVAGHSSVGLFVTAGSVATLEATLWHDNGANTGGGGTVISSTNVTGAPAFEDPSAWDYHITAGSAALDAGVNVGVTTDIDGEPRPAGGGYDIGADEYHVIGVQLAPDYTTTVSPTEVITYVHTLTNTGKYTDVFALTFDSTRDWATLLAGDTFTLAQGATATVRVRITVPPGSAGLFDITAITATSQTDPRISDAVTDTTMVGLVIRVALGPDRSRTVTPGTTITYTHVLANTGNYTETFALTFSSTQGWATLLASTPITLAQGTVAPVQMRIAVPDDAISGTVDTTIITATSQLKPEVFDTATDVTTVIAGQWDIYLPLALRNH